MNGAISVTGKVRQGDGAVFLPVPGQEMIIEDIDDNRRVMSVSLPESPFALRDLPVPVGEGVNLPVQNDASIYLSLIAFDASTFDEIGDEIAEHDRFRIAGEIKMSQEIHILRVGPADEMTLVSLLTIAGSLAGRCARSRLDSSVFSAWSLLLRSYLLPSI